MRILDLPRYIFVCATAVAIVAAGCSSNAGFGPSAGPGQGPQGYPNAGPMGAGGVPVPGASGAPVVQLSPAAATSIPLTGGIEIAGATARLAYDGAASDPQKAQRILIVTFAVKNASKGAISVKKLSIVGAGDYRPLTTPIDYSVMAPGPKATPPADQGRPFQSKSTASPAPQIVSVSVDVPSGKQSDAHVIALSVPDDISTRKQVAITFLPAKGKALAAATIDVAASDIATTPLDEKAPKGRLSVDSVDVKAVQISSPGPHFAVTFAVTNPSTQLASITNITIAPPKGVLSKVALSIALQPRSTTAFITVVLPYVGKALPSGKYTVTANGGGGPLASGFGTIL